MPQPSKGNRKQIAGRLPLEVFEAFEQKRNRLGLGQNDALILAIKRWSRDEPSGSASAEPVSPSPPPRPAPPRTALTPNPTRMTAAALTRPLDPLTGEPIAARKPYQKEVKK